MCKECIKLITSAQGPEGEQGERGTDGIINWLNYDLDCLIENEIIEESDTPEQITQKLINFWCISQNVLLAPPTANNNTFTTSYNTPITFNPTLNDISSSYVNVTILTGPVNGTAIININNAQEIIYTPNNGFEGNDTIIYQITDLLGQTDTATITITVEEQINPVCSEYTASHIADLSIYNSKLRIQLINTSEFTGSNIQYSNDYLITVYDNLDNVLYSYNVVGNLSTVPQVFITPQNVTSEWDHITIDQTFVTVVVNGGDIITCGSESYTETYTIPDIQVSFYNNVDYSCLEVDEGSTDAEITQALITKSCLGSTSKKQTITQTIVNSFKPGELSTYMLEALLNPEGLLDDYYIAEYWTDTAGNFNIPGSETVYEFKGSDASTRVEFITPSVAYDTEDIVFIYFTNGVSFYQVILTFINKYQPEWNILNGISIDLTDQEDLEQYGIKVFNTSVFEYSTINLAYLIKDYSLHINYQIIMFRNGSTASDPIGFRPEYLLTNTGLEVDTSIVALPLGSGSYVNYLGIISSDDWITGQLTAVQDSTTSNFKFVKSPTYITNIPINFSTSPDDLTSMIINYNGIIPLKKI